MTESEWLACADPKRVFRLIEEKASQRKCVLFSVACHCLPPAYDPSFPESLKRQAVKLTAAADFADGRIDVAEVRRLWLEPEEDRSLPERGREWAIGWAYQTVWDYEDPFECDIAALVREVFGNPSRPVAIDLAWLTPTVSDLATAAYEDRILPSGKLDPARLAFFADALEEEAGCDGADILSHLRSPGPHVRGCWAVDLLLGKV